MADLFFLYGDVKVGVDDTRPAVVDWEKGLFVRRDMDGEDRAPGAATRSRPQADRPR